MRHDSSDNRAVLEAAVRLIWGRVNVADALSVHPSDRNYAQWLFEALHRSDYELEPAHIESWASANGWTLSGAAVLSDIAKAVLGGKRRTGGAVFVSVLDLDRVRWFAWGVRMRRAIAENARLDSLDGRFVLEAVLELIHNRVYVTDGLFHPGDRGYAYRLFEALHWCDIHRRFGTLPRSDYALDATYIERWAEVNGWSPRGAASLRDVAQAVLAGKSLRRIGSARLIRLDYVEWFVLGVRKFGEVMEIARRRRPPTIPAGVE